MTAMMELRESAGAGGMRRRRWFSSPEIDLIVWYGEDGAQDGFELYYDKNVSEHVLIWRESQGFRHLAVDDGEQKPALEYKESPILVPDGQYNAGRIRRLFASVRDELPKAIADLVELRLSRLAAPASGRESGENGGDN
ncbi:MAG: hypothetical protein KJN94_10935 [Gammaproteobacteria bacterium]|nr:hypothetical protein [Gammaproteobacteria bacterium]